MAKHIMEIMPEADFVKGTKLDKLIIGRLFKGDKHPLKVLQKKLRAYHELPRANLGARHALLKDIVDDCIDYAGSKSETRQTSTKVTTVIALRNQASLVAILEAERAAELGAKMTDQTAAAAEGGLSTVKQNPRMAEGTKGLQFEQLNKEGEASIRGDELVAYAKEKYKIELTGDPGKDWYMMKKLLKQLRSEKAKELDLVYLNAEQRDDHLMLFIDDKNGYVVSLAGDLIHTPTTDKQFCWIYACDEEGFFYGANEKAEREKAGKGVALKFQHSSFLAGRPVVCAGTIRVDQGRLIEIDQMSGHYQPLLESLVKACDTILSTGYDPKDDGYAVFIDFANKLGQGDGKGFRVPMKEFVKSEGKPKNVGDFEVKGVKFTFTAYTYVNPAAAKKRGCKGAGI